MKGGALLLALLLMGLLWLMVGCATLSAQEPVQRVPDIVSWATASANPVIAVVQAFRSDTPRCRLGQLGISGGITATAGLLAQHYVTSPRPCLGSPGCAGNGAPSMHAAISALGISRGVHTGLGVTLSISLAIGTAGGRVDAQRHTKTQAALGLALGGLAEWGGRSLLHCGG